MDFLLIILTIVILIVAGAGGFLLFKKRKITQLEKSLGMVLFLVKMPKYEKKEEKEKQDIKAVIGMMEQIYSNFLYLEKPKFIKGFLAGSPRVALEIASEVGGSDISFYIAVPTEMETSLEKYVPRRRHRGYASLQGR